MFGRFFGRFHTQDSNDARYESASCCDSFYAALLLLIDTVIAVSIFVCTDNLVARISILVCVLLVHVLLTKSLPRRSKPLAASI